MDIVLVGFIALSACEKTIALKEDELKAHFSLSFIEKTKKIIKDMSLNKKEVYEMFNGKVKNTFSEYIKDDMEEPFIELSETGVFGSLWKLGEIINKGFSVNVEKISVKQEIIEILEYFDANPYTYPSKGAFLLACDNGGQVVADLNNKGITASVIGYTHDSNERVIINGNTKRFLTPDDRLLKDEQDLQNNKISLRKELV